MRAARTAGPRPGDWDPETRRSASRCARVRSRTVRGGLDIPEGSRSWLVGRKDRCRPLQRPYVKSAAESNGVSRASAAGHKCCLQTRVALGEHLGSSRHLARHVLWCGRPPPRHDRAEHYRRGSETGALATKMRRASPGLSLEGPASRSAQRPPGVNSGPTRSFAEHQAAKVTP